MKASMRRREQYSMFATLAGMRRREQYSMFATLAGMRRREQYFMFATLAGRLMFQLHICFDKQEYWTCRGPLSSRAPDNSPHIL
jgi:hypothetical protein